MMTTLNKCGKIIKLIKDLQEKINRYKKGIYDNVLFHIKVYSYE